MARPLSRKQAARAASLGKYDDRAITRLNAGAPICREEPIDVRRSACRLGHEGAMSLRRCLRFSLKTWALRTSALLWPSFGVFRQLRWVRVKRISRAVNFDLVVRMEDRFRPKDLVVVPPLMSWFDFAVADTAAAE